MRFYELKKIGTQALFVLQEHLYQPLTGQAETSLRPSPGNQHWHSHPVFLTWTFVISLEQN